MSYIIYIIIGFLAWWLINAVFILQFKRPKFLNLVNQEDWLQNTALQIFKKIGDIEQETEKVWRKEAWNNEEEYKKILLIRRHRWVRDIFLQYILSRDIEKMMGFVNFDSTIERLIVTTLWSVKLYWNFIGIADSEERLYISIMHWTEQKQLLDKIEKEEDQVLEILKKELPKQKKAENKFDHTKNERVAREDCPF